MTCGSLVWSDNMDFIENRLKELYNRANEKSYNTFSDFLNLEEQSALLGLHLPCVLYGGFDNAERVVAGFGDSVKKDDFGIVCLEITPKNKKFSEDLRHRDYLGTLLNIGIKRETLGDIVVCDKKAYLFCLEKIADFIIENLQRVRHTRVLVQRTDFPEIDALEEPDSAEFFVPSLRIDVVISAVYNISRKNSNILFAQGKVFLNGRQTENASQKLNEGDMISIRGKGRLKLVQQIKATKKDKLLIAVKIYR